MIRSWFQKKNNKDQLDGRYLHGNEQLIQLRNVVKTYKSASGTFSALKGVNLSVCSGEFISVVGKSGSGKSTLLNMLAGIDRPSSGQVFVGDTAVHLLSEGKMAVWRGQNLGIVFQFFQLLPTLTVIENIMLPMDFCHKFSLRERRRRAFGLLEQMALEKEAYKLPSALSGGQQQRVAIARALANDPPVVVADEPTGNLDSQSADSIFTLFENLVSQGKTILVVTHDRDLSNRTQRRVVLADGEIVEDILADQLTGDSENNQLRRLPPGDLKRQKEIEAIRNRVARFLDDEENAVPCLQAELRETIHDRQVTELIYRSILEEVNQRSAAAEQAGDREGARVLWKILLQATEPWGKSDSSGKPFESELDQGDGSLETQKSEP